MEIDQASTGSAKRLADTSGAGSVPADSGSSSDKRQRQQSKAPPAVAVAVADDASSSLLPLQPLTEEAARRLQRLGSPEEEQEEEGAALAQLLGGPGGPAGEAAPSSEDPLLGLPGQHPENPAAAASTALADQLSELHLVPGSSGELALSSSAGPDSFGGGMSIDIDTHDVAARVQLEDGPPPLPGSPAAAERAARAATAASPRASPRGGQPLGPETAAAAAGQQGARELLIRELAAADAAEPIQMLPLEALSKNPLLQQFQQQRAAEARAQQTARAVAAGAALRAQQGAAMNAEDDADLLDGTLIGGGS